MRKYGLESFEFIILEKVDNVLLLDQREQYWMDHYISYERDSGYNLSRDSSVNRGYKTSLEHKKKCSDRQKRLWKDPAYIKNVKDKLKLKNLDTEWKNKVRIKQKEALQKPEYRKQNSERNKKLWQNPVYRAKMVEARKYSEAKRSDTINKKAKNDPAYQQAILDKRKQTNLDKGLIKIHTIDKDRVKQLYIDENYKGKAVAKIMGISYGLLAKFLLINNLQKPRNLYKTAKDYNEISDVDIHKLCDTAYVDAVKIL